MVAHVSTLGGLDTRKTREIQKNGQFFRGSSKTTETNTFLIVSLKKSNYLKYDYEG
jgi:hypothetical protein